MEIEREHFEDISFGRRKMLDPEKYPADHYDQESIDQAWQYADLLQDLTEKKTLDNEKKAMISAPDHKIPRRAMPKA